MARYMPQDLFNSCAILAAKCYYDDEIDEQAIIERLVGDYRSSYKDDQELSKDINEAAKIVLTLIEKWFPDRGLHTAFDHLLFLNQEYDLDGRKRRRKMFDGTIFNRERRYNKERVKKCVADVLVYHTGTVTGVFPIKGG